ncbi:hypothetical protein [Blautia hydrogenotrophica]|uniref:hypothetical protein n=1 Tax=Blautia hydrogenotrophica TaxID=53443 RepID=UPI003AB64263
MSRDSPGNHSRTGRLASLSFPGGKGEGRYQYTFEMQCPEAPGIPLADGAVRIFLNTHGHNPQEVSPGKRASTWT